MATHCHGSVSVALRHMVVEASEVVEGVVAPELRTVISVAVKVGRRCAGGRLR